MDFKKIRRRMARLQELAAAWENEGRIDIMEKDIALGLLREIYGELRFGEPPAGSAVKEESAQSSVKEEYAPACCAVPEKTRPECETVTEPASEPVEGVAGVEVMEAAWAAPELELEPEVEPVPEPESVPEAAKVPEAEVPQKPVMPRRVDPDLIRSLYDSGEAVKQSATPVETEIPQSEPQTEPAPHPAPENIETAKPQTPAEGIAPQPSAPPKPAVSAPSAHKTGGNGSSVAAKTTLADTMSESRHTLGESLRNGQKDMASKLASTDKSTLRASIGLNDRFLMIRDMFEGDARAFDEAIEVLDRFTDMDDAVIHIHETYEWNADCEGVKLLIELLERKLGS